MDIFSNVSPYIRLAHDFRDARGLAMRNVRVVDHALHYFTCGQGSYTIGGVAHPIVAGRLFAVRPNEPFSIATDESMPCCMLNLHFDYIETDDSALITWPYPADNQSANRTASPAGFGANFGATPFIDLLDPRAYEAAFHAVYQHFHAKDRVSLLRIKAAAIALFAFVLQESERSGRSPITASGSQAVKSAVLYLRNHIAEHVSLDLVANASGVSRSHLCQLFRSQVGYAPLEYLSRMRIEQARILLASTDRPVKEIAASVGFLSIHHFSRSFHATTGYSPALYRAYHMQTGDSIAGF
jgi:AraC-like DNA-binding protein